MSNQIMLVDDDSAMLTLMRIALKRSGFTVIEAESAYKALTILESFQPDLIILDVLMPGMDGIELCMHIRARPQTLQTPVIMLSALTDRVSMKRAFDAGANDYLPKPAHQELVAKIRHILGATPPH